MTPHRPYNHTIDLGDNQVPPYSHFYPWSGMGLGILREFLDDMLRKGFICASSFPGGTPVLFAKKKVGTLRLGVDFQNLNKITQKNQYPIPLVSNLIDQLGLVKIYTKFNLHTGYYNVCITSGHEWKTSFQTRYGSLEFLVMPMGLTNALATFQHFMNDIFQDMPDVFMVVHLDDILGNSESEHVHRNHVRRVLTRLRENNLHVKLEKPLFHTNAIEFLGFKVSPQGIAMGSAKTEAISRWPTLSNVKQGQSFIGFANFYHHFIVNFSETVTPLTRLTRKDTKSSRGPEHQ